MSKNIAPKNNVFYRNQNWHYPKVTHSKGIYLYDETGKEYIDGCSGSSVANIGHGNEEIAEATAKQIKRIAFSHLSRFTTDAIENCCDEIAALTPGNVNHSYLVSGGSEATETAIKLARQYFVERDKNTSKWKIISRWKSFHGNTIGSLSMTGITGRRKIYDPILINFPKINQAYCYRCPYNSCPDKCSLECAYELEIQITQTGPENISAFIAEPVIGSAVPGANPPKEYFKIIREICTKYDVLLIIDEVMAGFGRTGKNFGIDHYDVVPDIITTAKGMSCGYTPIGAAIANDEIFNTIMVNGTGNFVHGHTYGGNPLSAAIADCVLKITKREKYFENSAKQGITLMEQLQELYEYPIVGDIRGKGLMIGIEFVKNQKNKKPFDTSCKVKDKITKHCLDEGLVVYPGGGSVDGVRGDHILLSPPINITFEETKELFCRLKKGFENFTK
ncbi:MAG: aminotransferase class III-fold pyridoxal phosphate-dependent enzyme [bacterium]|nr:aminotransferase class III-fold pyridoxal phosphate-dependent enzyme [bacterium]